MKAIQIFTVVLLILSTSCNQPKSDTPEKSSNVTEIGDDKYSEIITSEGFTCEAEEFNSDKELALNKVFRKQTLSNNEDDGSEITMLVVYTTKAKNKFQNADSLHNAVRRAENNTNEIFKNNGIDLHLKVVQIEEISAFKEISMKKDLGDLINGNKGLFTRDLRNKYFADVVCFIRSDGGGRATLLNPTTESYHSEYAYMAIGSGCIDQSYFCFAHELGHLLGCNHNTEDTDLKGMYEYSYGWYFDLPNDNPDIGKIGTIMSYPGAENRILYFSDPTLGYQGVPLGSEKANNVKTIKQTKKRVANYRVKTVS